jgi:hypothetical protein
MPVRGPAGQNVIRIPECTFLQKSLPCGKDIDVGVPLWPGIECNLLSISDHAGLPACVPYKGHLLQIDGYKRIPHSLLLSLRRM